MMTKLFSKHKISKYVNNMLMLFFMIEDYFILSWVNREASKYYRFVLNFTIKIIMVWTVKEIMTLKNYGSLSR